MKRVELIIPSRVNLPAGTVVEVSEQEASRLYAFGIAKEAKKERKKKSEDK